MMAYKDPAKKRAYGLAYRAANLEKIREKGRAYMASRKEKTRAYSAAYRAANLEKVRAAGRAYRAKNIEKALAYSASYNPIYRATYRKKLNEKNRIAQGMPEPTRPEPQLCECCGKLPGKTAMCLDHCHSTGVFRGWLCGRCNRSIGQLGDSIEGLMKAVRYLERAAKQQEI
jgi:hypothetical protein